MIDRKHIALVTGGTDGIGLQVALRLAQEQYDLILVGRNPQKAEAAMQAIRANAPDAEVQFWQYDLSLMREGQALIARLHETVDHLDTVVLCAGVILRDHTLTDEGLETVFAVQYLARYQLIHGLIDLLQAADAGCVVNVSAGGTVNIALDFDNLNGEKSYDGVAALRQESVANDMLMLDLAEAYPDLQMVCYGPGYVKTALMRDMPMWFQKISEFIGIFIGYTPEQAAEDILMLVNEDYESGLYDRKAQPTPLKGERQKPETRQRLQAITEQMIAAALQDDAHRDTKSAKSASMDAPMRSG